VMVECHSNRSPERIIDDISALEIRNLISPHNVCFPICNRNVGCRFFVSSGLSEHLGLNFVSLYLPAAVQRAEEVNG
jgi:hypothetical protein